MNKQDIIDDIDDLSSEYRRVQKKIDLYSDDALVVNDYFIVDQLVQARKYLAALKRRIQHLKEQLNAIH